MAEPTYRKCTRGAFCLKGFPPSSPRPNGKFFCEACLKDIQLKQKAAKTSGIL